MANWEDLRFFGAIARAGSLSGAARELKVNHSTVFRRLNALESSLGVRLFDRLQGRYVLTAAGESMGAGVERVHNEIDTLERQMLGQDHQLAGEIRLATTDALAQNYLQPHLLDFHQRYPRVRIELLCSNLFFDLSKREADIALRPTNDPPGHLIGRELARSGWAVYGAPAYLDGRDPPREEADLKAHTLIAGDSSLGAIPANRWLQSLAGEAIAMQADSFVTQWSAVRAGFGLAVLPCALGDQSPELRRVLGPIRELETGLWLLTHPDLRQTTRIRTFVAWLGAAVIKDRALFSGEMADPA